MNKVYLKDVCVSQWTDNRRLIILSIKPDIVNNLGTGINLGKIVICTAYFCKAVTPEKNEREEDEQR